MKRFLHCLLAVAIVFVCSSSIAVASCPDTIWKCYNPHTKEMVDTIYKGNCATAWVLCIKPCNPDLGQVARECNFYHPRECSYDVSSNQCVACIYSWIGDNQRGSCVDNNGNYTKDWPW